MRPKGKQKYKKRDPTYRMADFADEICEWISKGKTLRDYCRQDGKPSWDTVYNWAKADEQFAQRFARAREDGQDVMSEECMEIADTQPADQTEVQWMRVRIETRLKLLAKWNPKKYGDRSTIDHAGGVSINVITGVPKRETNDQP